MLEHALAPARAAVEVAVVDALVVEALANLGQEARELAEDERAVAAADDVAELLDQRAELRAGHASWRASTRPGCRLSWRSSVIERRIVKRLRSKSSIKPEDLLALALQVGVVELAVARMQVHLERLLLLGRQVAGHQLLRAALDQRLDPAP